MRNANRWIAGVVSGLLVAGSALAQDWPQWRGVNRDDKVADFKAPATWPKELTQKWKVTVGTGDSTPALVGDKLYVFARQGGDEVIMCLSAADGKEVWKEKYPAPTVGGPAAGHGGPRSSPAVAGGKVVTLGVAGSLRCWDATSGKLIWKNEDYKAYPQFFTALSPIIVDGLAIAHLGGGANAAVVGIDLASGDVKWKWTGEPPTYSSPILMMLDGTKQILEMTNKSIVGIAVADGKLLWQAPAPTQGRAYNAATPIVDGQTIYLTGSGRGTKAVKLEKQGDTFAPKELWTNPTGTQFNTPVLQNGLLFGISDKGNLFCIDAQDGKTAWSQPDNLGNFGSTVAAGSAIVALSAKGDMIVCKPEKTYGELAKYKVSDKGNTYAHPILSGNRIFVKDQDSLILWTLE